MKFFTLDLYTRTCSRNDRVADAAHAEWEQALARYERRLRKIWPELTPGLRRLSRESGLHDAALVFFWRRGPSCFLGARPEQAPEKVICLRYSLVADPLVEYEVFPKELQSSGPIFLYDEIDPASTKGRKCFSHTILWGNGMSVGLLFRNVKVEVVDSLYQTGEPRTHSSLPQPA
jgi:hypothetical protein